jgi:hypothetical protein
MANGAAMLTPLVVEDNRMVKNVDVTAAKRRFRACGRMRIQQTDQSQKVKNVEIFLG